MYDISCSWGKLCCLMFSHFAHIALCLLDGYITILMTCSLLREGDSFYNSVSSIACPLRVSFCCFSVLLMPSGLPLACLQTPSWVLWSLPGLLLSLPAWKLPTLHSSSHANPSATAHSSAVSVKCHWSWHWTPPGLNSWRWLCTLAQHMLRICIHLVTEPTSSVHLNIKVI